MNIEITRAFVKNILEGPHPFEWSLQGLGMLRLYLSKELRLHIWDSRFAVHGVSRLHTHPWDFESTIVAGELANVLYIEDEAKGGCARPAITHMRQKLRCGVGGGLCDEPEGVRLKIESITAYGVGESYKEGAERIHDSRPLIDGTVTLVRREFCEDTEHAFVLWPVCGGEWGSAEPKRAEPPTVERITKHALRLFA